MAIYFVDFIGGNDNNNGTSIATPWKRVRGMLGAVNDSIRGNTGSVASNATLVSGDTVIFKGGVTWFDCYPWVPVGGTTSGITYTSDATWFSGASFVKPAFDNQNRSSAYSSLTIQNPDPGAPIRNAFQVGTTVTTFPLAYLTFDNLQFNNAGVEGVNPHDGCWMYFSDTHHMTVNNNTMDAKCGRFVIAFFFFSAGTRDSFTVTNNDVQKSGSFMWFASSGSGCVETNLVVVNNVIHNFAPQLGAHVGGGNHGDGFIHIFSNPVTDATQWVDRITFVNNRAYGAFNRGMGVGTGNEANEDMTGFFFVEGAVKNCLIANLDITLNPPGNSDSGPAAIFGDGAIFLRQNGNTAAGLIWIVNCTLNFSPTIQVGSSCITTESGWSGGLIIQNCILSIGVLATWNQGGGTFGAGSSLDYNIYRDPSAFFPPIMTDGGHSVPGHNTNPLVVNDLSDNHLQSTSPARNAGKNLSALAGLTPFQQALLNKDRDGVSRPASAAWDIGAYQFGSAPDTTPPAVPTGLQVI